jgi:hypothetical protein
VLEAAAELRFGSDELTLEVEDVDSTLEDVVGNAELLEAVDDKETAELEAAAELGFGSDELTLEDAAA